MTTLFDPIKAGDLALANRIVMAPLTRNRSPNAVPGDLSVTYYRQRATAGLIVTEATAITHQGQGYADVPGLYAPPQLAGWKKVTDAVHEAGGKIVVQLWHVGRISHDSLQPGGGKPVAPSAVRAKSKTFLIKPDGTGEFTETSEPRALARSELPGIVDDFRRAAKAAIEIAEFDGVEIHGANGYLVDQFLRAGSNRRTDDYGGSIENRSRFLFEVVDAVAGAVGAGRTGIRLSPVTPANDSSDPDPQPLFNHVASGLGARGLAYIHVIEGATGGDRDFRQGEQAFDYAAFKAAYRNAGGTGAWLVNNGYDKELAERTLAEAHADLVAFGKLFIANPDLVRRLRENVVLNAPDKTTFLWRPRERLHRLPDCGPKGLMPRTTRSILASSITRPAAPGRAPSQSILTSRSERTTRRHDHATESCCRHHPCRRDNFLLLSIRRRRSLRVCSRQELCRLRAGLVQRVPGSSGTQARHR
jgi:N-ethylmaleimide reductase